MTDQITDTQIATLRSEADEHGDLDMVAICMVALGADRADAEPGTSLAECTLTQAQARAECARVIDAAAAAMDSGITHHCDACGGPVEDDGERDCGHDDAAVVSVLS